MEKFINYEEAIIENNNQQKEETKIIGHKTKRTPYEKSADNYSNLEEPEGKNKKNKKKMKLKI